MLGRWGRTGAVGLLSVSLMMSVQGGVVLATATPAVAAEPSAPAVNSAADKAAELASAPVTLLPPAEEPAPAVPVVVEPPVLSPVERAKAGRALRARPWWWRR